MPQKPGSPRRGRFRRKRVAALVVVAAVLLVGAFFAYPILFGRQSGRIQPVTVTIPKGAGATSRLNFSPVSITVVTGVNNTVIWVNMDTANHTVVATQVPKGAATFSSSGPIRPGQSFEVTLTAPGVYEYQDGIYPTYMQGAVVVKLPT